LNVENYDLVGIGCQIIGFGAPNIVHQFIKLLPAVNEKKVFIFRTAGGVAPINYNASKPIIRKLFKKGYNVFYERVFSIGSNWMTKFDDEIIKQLYSATEKKVAVMCNELIHGEERFLETGTGLRILMKIVIFAISKIIFLVGKDFKVSDSCVHCGLCVRNCPAENIMEKDGKIKFKYSCNSCMRCVYSCPKSAINFRLLTFFPVPGGYDIKKILSQPSDGGPLKNKIPPFFHDYVENDKV
jgi:ferredoxin